MQPAAVLLRPHAEPHCIGLQQSVYMSSFPLNQQFRTIPSRKLHLGGSDRRRQHLRHHRHGLAVSHAFALVVEQRRRLSRPTDNLHLQQHNDNHYRCRLGRASDCIGLEGADGNGGEMSSRRTFFNTNDVS